MPIVNRPGGTGSVTGDPGNAVVIDTDGHTLVDGGVPPSGGGLNESEVDARIEALIEPSTGTAAATIQLFHGDGTASQTSALQSLVTAMQGTGGVIFLQGDVRLDSEVTFAPTADVSLRITSLGQAKIYSGGTQDHKFFNFSAPNGVDADIEIDRIRFLGGGASGAADTDYRFIKVSGFRKVRFERLHGEYCRGMSFTATECVDVEVDRCTVIRSRKDGINIASARSTRVKDNLIWGCGDNAIACHSEVRVSGTFGASAITTHAGSTLVDVTFPASNSLRAGDSITVKQDLQVDGIEFRGQWKIATKPTGSTATLTAPYNGAAGASGGSVTFDGGAAVAGDRFGGVTVTGNKIIQALGGIRILGGEVINVRGNEVYFAYGEAIGVYDISSTGEGDLDPELINIDHNTIRDLIRVGTGSISASGQNVAIYVNFRGKTVPSLRVTDNTIDLARTVTLSTTTPADLVSDLAFTFGGGLATDQGFWTSSGYYNTAFTSSQPINGVHTGVQIRCANANDKDAVFVGGNRYIGTKAHRAVQRDFTLVGKVKFTAPASIEDLLTELGISAPVIDLMMNYSFNATFKSGGDANFNGLAGSLRLKQVDGDGGYIEESAGTPIATGAATLSTGLFTDYAGTEKVLTQNAQTLVEVWPMGYLASTPTSNLTDILCHVYADQDDCVAVNDDAATPANHVAPLMSRDPYGHGRIQWIAPASTAEIAALTEQTGFGTLWVEI